QPPSPEPQRAPRRVKVPAMRGLVNRLKALEPRLEVSDLFPPLEQEFEGYTHLFKGRVLNAGSGDRDISQLIDGELVNQDLDIGLHNENIHVYNPLHDIPFDDGYFDVVICNAVLEHVRNPHEVVAEFARVTRPGGTLYLCVPFMQPEHLDPTDFQRYTLDGLKTLIERFGYDVADSGAVHNVYTTLGWIFIEWLRPFPGWKGKLVRWAVFPLLRRQIPRSRSQIHSLASAYRVVGTRREA
ncbi:MAG: hypothetical protein JWM93_957, partial [Frankiales bacterium]|nr:hypothetical protein [Frankiales bacterium]